MKRFLWLSILILFSVGSVQLFAKSAKKGNAHTESGTITVNFQDTRGSLHFDFPATGIFGFEHRPQSDSERKKVGEALTRLSQNIPKGVKFSQLLSCQWKKNNLTIEAYTSETRVLGEFSIQCQRSPEGTKLVVDLVKTLPKIGIIQFDWSSETVQKSVQILRKPGFINLKP